MRFNSASLKRMRQIDFYTVDSVASIMKQEEDRGRLKDSSYSDDVKAVLKEFKDKKKELKEFDSKPNLSIEREMLDKKVHELARKFNELKEKDHRELVHKISNGKFKIKIETRKENGKDIFFTKGNESMVISRIISKELAHRYSVKPAERNAIIEQLIAILNNPMPKIVIRADVQHFYESIPQGLLMERLINDGFTSKRTIKYLKSFLYYYNSVTKNSIGIPRGLSFSAYLSEIYMTSIDVKVNQMTGIYFYKRYVDDIIIVANPQIKNMADYWKDLNDIFSDNQLELHNNSPKKYMSLLDEDSKEEHFEYLGYKFIYDKGHLRVLLSDRRFNKYLITINALFDVYSRCASSRKYKKTKDEKDKRPDALRQLINRLRVITSNGLLSGRKSFVATGVYYTNKYLTDLSQLKQLDCHMQNLINNKEKFSPPSSLFNYGLDKEYDYYLSLIKEKLLSFSFETGFNSRKLYKNHKYSDVLCEIQRIFNSYYPLYE